MSETTRTDPAPRTGLVAEEPAAAVKVLPARHPWRWVATAVVAVLAAMAVNALVTNPAWEWPTVGEFLFSATILTSMWLTVQLTIVGTVPGSGTVQAEIAATTKKDNGLVLALADALNHLIGSGAYAETLERWNLANEAVPTSAINPPGLPKTD